MLSVVTYDSGVYEVAHYFNLFLNIYVVKVNAGVVNQLGDGGEV